MKTVKIRCFSAINGEKTFVWNGAGTIDERNAVSFRDGTDEYRFRWTPTMATFVRSGEVSLELNFFASKRGSAVLKMLDERQTLGLNIRSILIEPSRFAVVYQIEDEGETHVLQLTWT